MLTMLICRVTIIIQRPSIDHADVVVTPDVQYFFSNRSALQRLQHSVPAAESDDGKWLELSKLVDEAAAGLTSCKLFACAGPGSFYGRLVPARSLDVVICVIALHWISQVLM